MKQIIDQSKKGTLILGYFRNGTHFLQDAITDRMNNLALAHDEICTDNSADQFKTITTSASTLYNVAILNNTSPKFYIQSQRDLLSKWHVINLTRNDKIHHFISQWFWSQNASDERFCNTGKFKHHGTEHSSYKSVLGAPQHVDMGSLIVWLNEQLINYHIPSDVTIDYSELPDYQTDNLSWRPNQYNDIQLSDIIENHQEVYNLLVNYKP